MFPFYTLQNIQSAARLSPPARLAVFGDPVGHSLSPQMHNPALAACGIEASYVRLQVKTEEFLPALRALRELRFIGANVTIPHKFTALDSVDEVGPAARRLGAVNTILFRPDGTTLGRNSDGPGFVRTIQEEFQAEVRDLRILLLGAGGGAGGAVAVQSALEGCRQLVLTNRTESKARTLAATLGDLLPGDRCRTLPWTAEALAQALPDIDLIINGTSLGMSPDDPPLLPAGCLTKDHLVYDMVYKPLVTPLIATALAAGAKAINGLPMLLWQGAQSFEWWFERPAPVDAMRAGLNAAVSSAAR
ncbi:MAG: shikimate dehydrogenase [Verrucomicrobiaceae bacterium]|nr:MAG: shikimate dehydrogenase [Verrucomicrobiaceae bacterium]